jgi:hypothetical protein
LAWHLSTSGDSKQSVNVKEWQRSSDPQSIDVALQKEKTPTIYILNQVSPQNVPNDLEQIHKAAILRQHYVIVTTDIPQASWKLSEEVNAFWKQLNLSKGNIYRSEDLVEVLDKALEKAVESLQQNALDKAAKSLQQVREANNLQDIANKLKTPDKIARFVQLLEQEGKREEEGKAAINLSGLIDIVNDNQKALNQWYYHILTPREQLLALGLSFFDGLRDDQFFSAIEQIVENVWQKRDPSLRALDYCDLDNLRHFFNLIRIGEQSDEQKIESSFPKQRLILFKVAWESHRRQILAALPTIETLIKNSVAHRDFNKALYGTYPRRHKLRGILSEMLSEIGWISPMVVEDTLIHLAADSEISVQVVAANAMARWRDSNYWLDQALSERREKELFEWLHNWQNDARIISQIKNILKNRDEESSRTPQDYLRATVVLTVGEAAKYDPSNELHSELLKLLKKLSDDPNQLVRNRYCYYTLPLVVLLHFIQLRGLLRYIIRHHDLIEATSTSVALAYRIYPKAVCDTLDSWVKNPPNHVVQPETEPPYEHVLETVILTYGKINYEEGIEPLTYREAFSRLQGILKNSQSPQIRRAVIIAMFSLYSHGNHELEKLKSKLQKISTQLALEKSDYLAKKQDDFVKRRNYLRRILNELESKLQEISAHLTLKERDYFVKILTEIYLQQRQRLEDGDSIINIKGHHYYIWLDIGMRPKTAVEETMIYWVKNDSYQIAQEIATQAFVSFALALDIEEAKRIEELNSIKEETLTIITISSTEEELFNIKSYLYGLYIGKLVPWFATLKEKIYQISICHLLPEAWKHHKQNKQNQEAMDFVLEKWENTKNDSQLVKISKFLTKGFWWAKNLPWFVIGTIVVIGVLLLWAVAVAKPVCHTKGVIDNGVGIFVTDTDELNNLDFANFKQGGQLFTTFTENATPNDCLGIQVQETKATGINVNGNNITYWGKIIGNLQGGGIEPLIVTFNADATPESLQAVVHSIAYNNVSKSPIIGERKVKLHIELPFRDADKGGKGIELIQTISQHPKI